MGRASNKENKNIYQNCREACGYTRAQAAENLVWISDSRIEKIESEKCSPTPDEVLCMAKTYKKPELCNYFCSHECPIGQKYVPEVTEKSLSQIVLEMLAALNRLENEKDRLIEITSDGVIHDDEIDDFVSINDQLNRISGVVSSLRFWFDKTIDAGEVNTEILNEVLKNKQK